MPLGGPRILITPGFLKTYRDETMGLSKFEVDKLIEKLRNDYRDYSARYNPKWFNLRAYEERFLMAIENKMNLEGFVLAEIENFEKIKEKFESRRIVKEPVKKFSEKVDSIIEENLSRIKKYPFMPLHESAGVEISHFYGAIKDFTIHYYSVLWIISTEQRQKMALDRFDGKLNDLALPRGDHPPKRLQDHINIISRPYSKEIDVEKDKNEYLKESAFILHDIIEYCDQLLAKRDSSMELPLNFEKLYVEDNKRVKIIENFSELTVINAIQKVKAYALGIIEAFRLKAFKK